MDLSVIIVNYNVKEYLKNLLLSLEKATAHLSTEIFVVDNASADGSVPYIRTHFPAVTVIANDVNLGFSKANNTALRRATGKYLLLINPDTLVSENTITELIKFVEAHPDAGIVTSKVLNIDGTLQLACRRSFPTPWVSFCRLSGLSKLFPKSKLFARYNLTYLDENASYPVDIVSGSFMFLTRTAFEKVGELDEAFFMYGEDMDWCYRFTRAGFNNYYVHTAQIIHYQGESAKRSSANDRKIFYEAMHIFARKHFGSNPAFGIMLDMGIYLRSVVTFIARDKYLFFPMAIDALVFTLSLILAQILYVSFSGQRGMPSSLLPYFFTIPAGVYLLSGFLGGGYQKKQIQIFRLLPAAGISFLLVSSITYFFKDLAYSRILVILTFFLAVVLNTSWRLIYLFGFGKQKTGMLRTNSRKVAIVGTGNIAATLLKKLESSSLILYDVVGFVGASVSELDNRIEGKPVIATYDTVPKIIKEFELDEIIFCPEETDYENMVSIVSACREVSVNFQITGKEAEYFVSHHNITGLNEVPLVEFQMNIIEPRAVFVKRLFDLAISFLAVTLFLPFSLYLGRKSAGLFRIKDIFQVIFGKKSLIGPLDSGENGPFLGKPGITGLWFLDKVNSENREKLNIFYARYQNIWLDFEILGKTIRKLL